MQKSLDQKIARILADSSCRDFILADAKDADMAFGLASPGKSPEHHSDEAHFRTLDEYRDLIREIVAQGLVDIMLMSASTSEILTIRERLFRFQPYHAPPAVPTTRATSGWPPVRGRYGSQPSQPFRTATVDHIMCGKVECSGSERGLGADLGLYSVTFNNDVIPRPRDPGEIQGVSPGGGAEGLSPLPRGLRPRYAPGEHAPQDLARFINDHIVRTLAGVTSSGRPLFLKIPYHGPKAIESLARYDKSLVVGILGGSSGTTFDAFQMLWEAKKYGARVALYGRKINNSEHQLSFVRYLRAVADDEILPAEAVRAYHGDLQRLGIQPYRPLDDDLQWTSTSSAYSGSGSTPRRAVPAPRAAASTRYESDPDFSKMTPAEKAMWNIEKWKRIIG